MRKAFILAAALGFSGQSLAQTTTCMNLGGGLVACDTPSPRGNVHTQCISHGTIVSCNSTGGSQGFEDDGSGDGSVVSFIQGINERKIRKRVGEFLAAGDCQGAARYAFEKGRIEFGQAILDRCQPVSATPRHTPPTNLPYNELVPMIARAAETYAPGFRIGGDLVVNSFRADGGTLRLSTNLDPASNPTTVVRMVCENPGLHSVLAHGGSVSIDFEPKPIDVSRSDCGL